MKLHEIITIEDEDNRDQVGEFLDKMLEKSRKSQEDKVHFAFLQKIFEKLSLSRLQVLCREKTQIDIIVNGQSRTKRYELVKPLRTLPIYELRYAMSGNEHLRLLFFPFVYEDVSHFVFVKALIKTLVPDVDETDIYKEQAYNLYLEVLKDPTNYFGG